LDLNKQVRIKKYGVDLPLQPADTIIIGGNNYRYGIVNGEFGVVANVSPVTETRNVVFNRKGGGTNSIHLTWRKAELMVSDEDGGSRSISGYVLENFLYGDNYLTPEEQQALYIDFKNRNPRLKPRTEEFKEAISSDLYFNCLKIKFGYAVTCHKAQGGEWDNTFVVWDKGVSSNFNFYESEHDRSGKSNAEFYRWAYTAITRASKRLYCLNPPYFDSFSSMSFIDIEVQRAFEELTDKSLEVEDVVLDDELLNVLRQFGLNDAAVAYQNHFIERRHHLIRQDIEITGWVRIGYEIHYTFQRGDEIAGFKYWVNGKDQFKPTVQKIPSKCNSDQFSDFITKLLSNVCSLNVVRDTVETVLDKVEFEAGIEEKKPFLRSLFDSLTVNLLDTGISISNISHLDYRERVTFNGQRGEAIIDFEYDGAGFFGRVLPLPQRCTDASILVAVKAVVNKLKNTDHVV
jgi:hypothetical protein